jgi:hypothetical protein
MEMAFACAPDDMTTKPLCSSNAIRKKKSGQQLALSMSEMVKQPAERFLTATLAHNATA